MTMRVRVTQIDGTLPNLALMCLSSYHRQRGDEIYFERTVRKHFDEPEYDVVYGSSIFKYSASRIARFRSHFPNAVIGGTGTSESRTVEQTIGEYDGLDYALYPDFEASIGFTQRGCRLSCKFCVVPAKEGKVKSVKTIGEIWRGNPHPKKLHLLDNDFFGQEEWPDRIAEIRSGGFKVCFSQGINVRAMTDDIAEAISKIKYRDNKFKERRLYTAWDNFKDEQVFFRGIDLLERHGVPAKHVMAYMLVGFDKNETAQRIFERFQRMVDRGIQPYPMPFNPPRNGISYQELKRFQRWVVTGLYRAIPDFSNYDASRRSKPRLT